MRRAHRTSTNYREQGRHGRPTDLPADRAVGVGGRRPGPRRRHARHQAPRRAPAAGGLGVLAGDILKEASDRAIPMVGVGLMYREGYLHQNIDRSGWQHEFWLRTDPERLPAALVTRGDGQPLTVTVEIRGRGVIAQ